MYENDIPNQEFLLHLGNLWHPNAGLSDRPKGNERQLGRKTLEEQVLPVRSRHSLAGLLRFACKRQVESGDYIAWQIDQEEVISRIKVIFAALIDNA